MKSDDPEMDGLARLKRLDHRVAAIFWVLCLFVVAARRMLVDGLDAAELINDIGVGDQVVLCAAVLATGAPLTSLGARRDVRIVCTMALLIGVMWLGVFWVALPIFAWLIWG